MTSVRRTSDTMQTGTVSLHVVRWTAANPPTEAPVVLVHGLASNALLWDGAARALAMLGHPVLAVDLRGHGHSEKPDSGYDVETVTDDVARLLEVLADHGLARPVVAGQSWGGHIVLSLAARFPASVRGVAPVDGGLFALADRFPEWDTCAEALRPPDLIGTPVDEMRARLRRLFPDWPETGIEGQMACYEVLDDATIRPWLTRERHMQVLRGLWESRPATLFEQIDVPVLFMPAENPRRAAFSDAKRQAAAHALAVMKRARVEWFNPADHDLHAQHPGRFAEVLHAAMQDGFFL